MPWDEDYHYLSRAEAIATLNKRRTKAKQSYRMFLGAVESDTVILKLAKKQVLEVINKTRETVEKTGGTVENLWNIAVSEPVGNMGRSFYISGHERFTPAGGTQ